MAAPSIRHARVASRPDTAARSEPFDLADAAVAFAAITFALWTLAFWVGLTLGIGWGLAGPLWVVGLIVAAVVWRRQGTRSAIGGIGAGSRSAWIVVAGILASSVGSRWWEGRPFAIVVVVGLFVVLEPEVRPNGTAPRSLVPVVVALAVGALGILSWYGFLIAVAVLTIWFVLAEIMPRWSRRLPMIGELVRPPAVDTVPEERPAALTWPVLVVAAGFAAFLLTTRGYLLDHGHYLNKSLHYAEHPGSYGIRDYMFGVDGLDHIPRGTILNAYETLAGFLSAFTGIGHVAITYHVLAVGAGFALPVGLAWSARELGALRPDLVGVTGTAAMVLLADMHDSSMVINRLAEGKLVAGMVALPVFIGAMVRFWRRDDTLSLFLACAAAVTTFGLSSTSGIALLPAVAAATAVGLLLTARRGVLDRTRLVRGMVPLAVVVVMSAVGFRIHRTISTGLDRFPESEDSWVSRLTGRKLPPTIDGREAQVLLLLACVAIVVLVGRTVTQRLLIGITFGGLMLGVYNPLLFTSVWDAVGVTGLSWRAGWALPLGLVVGLAVDSLHGRQATAAGGWAGAALVVALFALSSSPLASTDQGRPSAFFPLELEATLALLDATPVGGRFAAPERIEALAIAHSDDKYPTMVRPYFLADLSSFDDLPPEFLPAERVALAFAIDTELEGGLKGKVGEDIRARSSTQDPGELLDLLAIDTICIPPARVDPMLRTVLVETWDRVASHPNCNLFVRFVG